MLHTSLSSEARLLLLCATGSDDAAILRALEAGIDWDRVCTIAEEEKVTSLVWQRLHALRGAELGGEGPARLRRLAMVYHFRVMHLEQRLGQAVDALAGAGLECVLLKGAALAHTVYPGFAARPMSDLDLLVPPAQAARARDALLAAGWEWRRAPERDANYETHHHLPPLVDGSGTGVKLEIHTALFPDGHPFRLPVHDLWLDSRIVYRGSRRLRVPAPHHLLLHCCLHFAWSHEMLTGALRTFRDVAALTREEELDWERFTRLAGHTRAGTCCYWTFRLAHELAGVPVPEAVLRALRPPLPGRVLDALARHYALGLMIPGESCPSVVVRRLAWGMGCQPRWSGHGGQRPWTHEAAPPVRAVPRGRARRLAARLRNLRAWGPYLAGLLRSGSTPTASG